MRNLAYIANKVVLRDQLSPAVCVVPAGRQTTTSHPHNTKLPSQPLSLSVCLTVCLSVSISQNVDGLFTLRYLLSLSPCVSATVKLSVALVYASTRLLPPIYISLFVSFYCRCLGCLSSATGFPNVKWQQSERERGGGGEVGGGGGEGGV